MQVASIQKDLEFAIASIEKMLNEKDGEFIIETIRKFKKDGALDSYTLLELRHRLNKQIS